MWYISQVAIQDEDAQLKGFVAVFYTVGPKAPVERIALWKALHITHVFPARYVGLHFCYDDPNLRWMMSMASTVFETATRSRFRCHFGKLMHVDTQPQSC